MILQDALDVIKTNIDESLFHVDYDRVVALSELYKILVTGENIAPLLHQFIRREDDDLFAQRTRLTQIITGAVINSIKMPFNKVTRNRKVKKTLELGNAGMEDAVETMIENFYGDEADAKGLDYWLRTRFLKLSFLDPNAFVVIEFDSFDYRYSKPEPRPFEVSSREAINFKYRNNILQWLLIRQDIKFIQKGRKNNGYKYTLYDSDYTIVMERVGLDYVPALGEETVLLKNEKERYMVKVFEPKIGYCPAMRIGYLTDDVTDSRTYVAPYQPAMPYLMKSVKSVSEMDLSVSLHVFPQKMQYVKECAGSDNNKCHDGCDTYGNTCTACGGLGFMVHTSAQDALYFKMPRDKEEMLPLNDMLVYKGPPTDVLTFLDEYIDKLEIKCHRTMFNSDIFVSPKNAVAKTATEKNLEYESIYDTVTDFATRTSSLYVFFVWTFTILADGIPENSTIGHAFPVDLKMETQGTLLDKLKAANESKAPGFVRDSIETDIAQALYTDDDSSLNRFNTKKMFFPFNGKTENEIASLLNGNLVTHFDKILYANFETIFNKLELEFGPEFYKWVPEKQAPEIEKMVQEYIDKVANEKADSMANAFASMRSAGTSNSDANPGNDDETVIDENSDNPALAVS